VPRSREVPESIRGERPEKNLMRRIAERVLERPQVSVERGARGRTAESQLPPGF
jgi:hypothetical protein